MMYQYDEPVESDHFRIYIGFIHRNTDPKNDKEMKSGKNIDT